jgi:AmmeMemoRadiSam system protein B
MFYPAGEVACRREVAEYLGSVEPADVQSPILGGVVPHAGWAFSGATAAYVYSALNAQCAPETIVLFGAVHSWGVPTASMYGRGRWRSPLGYLDIDEELAEAVLRQGAGLVADQPAAHDNEHSIEVQLPFIKYAFPDAHILPIAVPPLRIAPEVGRVVAQAAHKLGRKSPALASSDLTHYGPRYGFAPAGIGEQALEWTKANDKRLLDHVVAMRSSEIIEEASVHHNACGAGAIAAAMAYAAKLGATRGVLLHQTTSYDVMPTGRPSDMVGYAAVIFT